MHQLNQFAQVHIAQWKWIRPRKWLGIQLLNKEAEIFRGHIMTALLTNDQIHGSAKISLPSQVEYISSSKLWLLLSGDYGRFFDTPFFSVKRDETAVWEDSFQWSFRKECSNDTDFSSLFKTSTQRSNLAHTVIAIEVAQRLFSGIAMSFEPSEFCGDN